MKKILLFASKYSKSENDLYLTNDLARELHRQGHQVTVVAFGDADVTREITNFSETIINIKSKIKILKYFFLWPKLFLKIRKIYRKENTFDQIIMFNPLLVMWPAGFFIKYFRATKKTAIILDIFPVHQVKIRALPTLLEKPLKFLERAMLANFTEITAPGENFKKDIESYYNTAKMGNSVKILQWWGRGIIPKGNKISCNKSTRIVFGGQIIKGREPKVLIDFLEELRSRGIALTLDIYSKGPGFEELKRSYSSYQWINFIEQIPRSEYFERLVNYDVGAIVTSRDSDMPTFPAKAIDYIEAGLCLYCIVEEKSDLSVLKNYPVVYINNFLFSEDEIKKSLEFFSKIKNLDSNEHIEELRNFFSAKAAATTLIS